MAAFDFLFGSGSPEETDAPYKEPTPDQGVKLAQSARPEPFGMMDVLGIGVQARKQQREQAYKLQGEGRAAARAKQVNEAENAITQRIVELRSQMPEDAPPNAVFGAIVRDPIFGRNVGLVPVEWQ